MGSSPKSRRNVLIFLILSVAFAAAATAILFVFFRSLETRVAQQTVLRQQELVPIVVAGRTLEQGTTLTADHLATRTIPRAYFLDTMISDPEAVRGRVPRERILAGEPLRLERLADPKAGIGLNALIPKGQRALQVELRGAAGVGGFVSPGDYVDLLFTGTVPRGGQKSMFNATPGKHTITMLQSKLVLAVDDLLAVEDDGSNTGNAVPSVTLALTPEEAQRVTHAQATGSVTLTLRNHVDVTGQPTLGVQPGSFIGAANQRRTVREVVQSASRPARPSRPAPPPPVDRHTTTIIEGASVRSVEEAEGSKR